MLGNHTDLRVQARATKGFAIITLIFIVLAIPLDRLAAHEGTVVSWTLRQQMQGLNRNSTHGYQHMEFQHENSYADEVLSEP